MSEPATLNRTAEAAAMRYEVRHTTHYVYSTPVSVAQHLLHLEPREVEGQRRLMSEVTIDPGPARRFRDHDYFGNPTLFLTIDRQHAELTIRATNRVTVDRAPPPDAHATPPWEDILRTLARPHRDALLDACQFTLPTPSTPALPEVRAYAAQSFTAGRPILDAAIDLNRRLHRDFRYDGTATQTHTPLAEAFALRHGVCQDFAHIGIACLRALGLPARYVSGYLLTRPPPGAPRLIGADASHAWFAVWTGPTGWIDLDPTNDVIPRNQHVTLAHGRDYGDVAPVAGLIYGGGRHRVTVAVDVVPF